LNFFFFPNLSAIGESADVNFATKHLSVGDPKTDTLGATDSSGQNKQTIFN
jgi:hypothetical protein